MKVGPKILGKILSHFPIRNLIESYAEKHPHHHLYDRDGSLYMGRYHLIDEDAADGTKSWANLLLRLISPYWSVRLHWINREDHDRDLHNHPFHYRTFVVRGWYTEVYLNPEGVEVERTIGVGDTAYSVGTFHRIKEVSPGGVETIFMMSRNTGEWGFRVANYKTNEYNFVPSREYFIQKQINPDGTMA